MVVSTLRENISATLNNWSAMLYAGRNFYDSKEYKINIIDRVGGGEAFTAGLIYGISSDFSNRDTLDYAAAAACLKHSIEGDFNLVSSEEIEILMKDDASGRVQR